MNRKVLGVDRLVAALLGLLLVLGGAAAVAWWGGWLAQLLASTPSQLSLASGVEDASWFVTACAAAALVLGVVSLWWLVAHLPRQRVRVLTLPGSGPGGQLRLSSDGPADAAAAELQEEPGIRSASGRLLEDRGELVLELRATVEPTADLTEVAAAAERVSGELRTVLGRGDVRGRLRLSVARNDRSARVH